MSSGLSGLSGSNPQTPTFSRANTKLLVSKQGTLFKREKGIIRYSWKERFVTVFEGSLLYYQTSTDLTPKAVVPLANAKIEETSEKKSKRKYCFLLQNVGKEDLMFACTDPSDLSSWITAISDNLHKEAAPPPQKEFKIKGKSPSIYLTSRIAETIASTGVGGKIVREMLSDEAIVIIDSIKNFMVQRIGAQQTSKLEKRAISLAVKAALSYKDKKLNARDIAATALPIRLMISRLIDAYEIPFTLSPPDAVESMRDVQAAFEKVLRPVLNDRCYQKFVELCNVFCDENLIEEFYEKKKWRECEIVSTTLRELWDNGEF